jgi:hypothetical protein
MPGQKRGKGKQADPKPKSTEDVVYEIPQVQSLKSYGENEQEELKASATEQMAGLMNAAGILRENPIP